MLLVENDKRGPEYSISLTYSDNDSSKFYIPENLYIIGMMNTADRSLAMVDYALRRRFCFIDLKPQFESQRYKEYLIKYKINKVLIDRIVSRMNYLNGQIAEDSDLGIGYQIGHSFFTPNKADKYDENWYSQIIDYEVEPLIREYWFDSIDKVSSALDALKK
jgi:5-methylcytosine-specific restriction protein B